MSKGGVFSHIDWGLITPVAVLALFGLTTLFSISIDVFRNQLLFLTVSFFAFVFFSNVNWKVLRLYSLPMYIFSVMILIFVLFVGSENRGAVRWIEFFGFQIQFSEIMKPFLIISLSAFLANKDLSLKTLFSAILFLMPIAFLIYKQPDLGNALIYVIVATFLFLINGFSFVYFFLGTLFIGILSPVIWGLLHEYQRQRVLTFLYPSSDPLGASYNVIQSVIAVGSGMVFGKGLGQGTQSMLRFLPERHTDFIFATFSEEFGFIGSLLLLFTFVFLLYKMFLIFLNTEDKFAKIFSAGAFFLILTQVFVNVGMNMGILPIVGVTLPFVSAGGSSVLSNFILLGFLSAISKNFKSKDTLEIK